MVLALSAPKQTIPDYAAPRLRAYDGILVRHQPGTGCVIETSTNRLDWRPFRTNTATSFTLDFEDPDATKFPRRFYCARRSEVSAVAHPLTSHLEKHAGTKAASPSPDEPNQAHSVLSH